MSTGFDDAGDNSAHLDDRAPRSAEIEQHRRPIFAHDDVVGSDVAMKKRLCMQHLQRLEQGRNNPVEFLLRRRAA